MMTCPKLRQIYTYSCQEENAKPQRTHGYRHNGIHLEIWWIAYFLSNMEEKHMMDVHLVAGDKGIGAHIKLMTMEIIKMGNMDVVITIVTNKLILVVPVNGISILNLIM